MNWIDRAVTAVDPEEGLRRAAARQRLQVLDSGYGNYGASRGKKSMVGWLARGGSAKEDIEDNLDTLRQRSRDAYMGVPVAAAGIKTMRTNVVAGGLTLNPQPDLGALGMSDGQGEALRAQCVREFALWADGTECDADGLDNFYQLQGLVYLGMLMNGDAFVLMQRRKSRNSPYTLKLRVVEADRVCSPQYLDILAPAVVQGHRVERIVQGVETDADGKVVAYWVAKRHPLTTNYTLTGQEWTRVEAWGRRTGERQVLHVMNRERAGQVRGVPMLAPVLDALKQLGRYSEAELQAALVGALCTVTLEKDAEWQPVGEIPLDGGIAPEQQVDREDAATIEMGAANVLDMPVGVKAKMLDPTHPTNGFDRYFDTMVKQIGAALEAPSEVILKQFSTSYSAARGALNEFWRTCGMLREFFAADFCQPVYEAVFREAVALGRIRAPGYWNDAAVRKAYTEATWAGPSRTNLNPKDEREASLMMVEAGYSTAESQAAQMPGESYAANLRQRAAEVKAKSEVDKLKYEGRESVMDVPEGGAQ